MDLVDVSAVIEGITGIGKSTRQKQNSLSVSDAWHLWDLLTLKYDAINIINVLLNFTNDGDLRSVIKGILQAVNNSTKELENLMLEYAIPLPQRPPKSADSTISLEAITDKYIFNRIFGLAKDAIAVLAKAFNSGSQPIPIKFFKKNMIEAMELIDNLSVYGEAKGYITPIPRYMP